MLTLINPNLVTLENVLTLINPKLVTLKNGSVIFYSPSLPKCLPKYLFTQVHRVHGFTCFLNFFRRPPCIFEGGRRASSKIFFTREKSFKNWWTRVPRVPVAYSNKKGTTCKNGEITGNKRVFTENSKTTRFSLPSFLPFWKLKRKNAINPRSELQLEVNFKFNINFNFNFKEHSYR